MFSKQNSHKNPLHPSALTINGLTPGRQIVRFNRYRGIEDEYIVLEHPQVREHFVMGRKLVVKLRSVSSGTVDYHLLGDIGVISYERAWNDVNFVVDHRKKHLLPTPLGAASYPGLSRWDDDFVEF